MKKCVIFGAGEYGAALPRFQADVFYIAADGGLSEIQKAGITPNLIVGDFDSLKMDLPQNIPVLKLPVKKDVTDMDAAVSEGVRHGCSRFVIYGGMGGRLDHTLANISLLARLSQKGFSAEMTDGAFTVTALTNASLSFDEKKEGIVSVFSFTDVSEGVSIRGLKYELENEALRSDFALGVSNSFIGKASEISVKNGTLIVTYENT